MKFSIVTPTLNRLEALKRCVGSVRGQGAVQYEHVVQDGVSTDGTADWLSIQRDLHVSVEKDSGMYNAINNGWSRSSGDILSWLNSDEQYLPGTLATVSEAFQANPDIDFIIGYYIVVGNDGRPIAARRDVRLSPIYITNTFLNAASCTCFFHRRLWDEGYIRLDERYRYASDMDMILRLIKAGKRYISIERYLSLFTYHGSNLSCHRQMLEETAQVRHEHGGFRSPMVRSAVRCCRSVERLFSGVYKSRPISFDYATDETPVYRRISAAAVPFFYQTQR